MANQVEDPRGRTAVGEPQRRTQAPRGEADGSQDGVQIPERLTISDLSVLLKRDPIEVIKEFMRNGFMYTINEVVEHEAASLIAGSFGIKVRPLPRGQTGPSSLVISSKDEDPGQLELRPPVVTILGHVDHGKTTLLDAIRKTNVVAGEAGGITQHIGAYQVSHGSNLITFLDTPGHEAFTAMRARGAQVTDVAVLVVAADDGVMPQTLEAISHVKAAGVPIIVAINKVDKPGADPERVKRQLAEQNLLIEEWGGDVIAVGVSAITGEGIEALLGNIEAVAEVGELRANPHRPARGVVVEARVDKSKGPLITVLVQTGTLRVGDQVVVGEFRGRVRALLSDSGKRLKEAGPSRPVEVMGIAGLPQAGDFLEVAADEKTARQIVEERQREKRRRSAQRGGVSLHDVHARIASGEVKALNLIVKTDVQGSIEAIRSALEPLNTERTRVNMVHIASGGITESDVMLAVASRAIILGFNTRPEPGAATLASQGGVEIRTYDIIYTLTDHVEKALEGLLEPVVEDVIEGRATVRGVFSLGKTGKVAGFYVNSGSISRNATIHVIREDKVLFEGPLASLKHFKDDVREVRSGLEGGLVINGFQDFREGDILEAHRAEQRA